MLANRLSADASTRVSRLEAGLDRRSIGATRPSPSQGCRTGASPFRAARCLDRVIVTGERQLRRTVAAFVAHYHAERNHQGLGNELIQPLKQSDRSGPVRRRQRIGGMLNYYYRAAWPSR